MEKSVYLLSHVHVASESQAQELNLYFNLCVYTLFPGFNVREEAKSMDNGGDIFDTALDIKCKVFLRWYLTNINYVHYIFFYHPLFLS